MKSNENRIIAVISPSKTMLEENIDNDIERSVPLLNTDSKKLLRTLKKLSMDDLKSLMKISDNLAIKNFLRYKDFNKAEGFTAGYLFHGDVFRGISISDLSKKETDYLNDHVFILSGLYGYLRFYDEIKPYRLEMGIPLNNERGKNLYEFWGDKVYKSILKNTKADVLINLASKEYYKVLEPYDDKIRVVNIKFLEKRKGKHVQIALFSKTARGLMARYMAENNVKTLEELKDFDYEGYSLNESLSKNNEFVFTR